MQRAARKDANHGEIHKEFEKEGFVVKDLSQLKNCCDIAVARNGYTYMIEIKDGSKPPSARKLTPGEIKFRDRWISGGGLWRLIESVEDVRELSKKGGK